MPRFLSRNAALLAVLASSALGYPPDQRLPMPELVEPNGFALSPAELPAETRIVLFFYSASWCAPCKPTAAALTKIYPDLVRLAPTLQIVTYSVDNSPGARADYLRDSQFPWLALSPTVIDQKPWLKRIPGGTPQLQAFAVTENGLRALAPPGDPGEVLPSALKNLRSPPLDP